MTDAEMDSHLIQAGACLLRRPLRVERDRDPSVTETSLWVYDGKRQVGSISFVLSRWKASRMDRGAPTSERWYATIPEAVQHVAEGWSILTTKKKG